MIIRTSTTKPVRVPDILATKQNKRITALTAYDFTTARLLDVAGVDIILVGDSLATVVQGHETTLPVTLDEMIYHCKCVTRGVQRALVVGDMPFLSYQTSIEKAIESAGRLLKEGGVSAVKLEGGENVADIVRKIVSFDIPVMGHVGLTPQSYHRMGGHKIQAKHSVAKTGIRTGSREQVLNDACALDAAGVFAIVLEGIPHDIAREITLRVSVPTIGIGAGPHCDGQILVSTDMLGLNGQAVPSFVKQFAALDTEIVSAVERFCNEVRTGQFPEQRSTKTTIDPIDIN